MLGPNSNKGNVKSIAAPVVSFALLGVLVVGAVIFGNLIDERTDGCRPIGSPAEKDDSATLFVWSDDDDALMLCDVLQETVKYDPPEQSFEQIELGDSIYRLRLMYDNEMQGGTLAEMENNNLTRDASRYPSEGYFSYERNVRGAPLYVKGEFGSLEDCGFFGEMSDYESDDFNGFDGSDMFHPNRIQSCWVDIEIESEIINGG